MFSKHTTSEKRANNFQSANRGDDDIRRIILHTTEGGPERLDFAEDVANFFAAPTTDVSAHYVTDVNSIVGCVDESDIAFHALGDNLHTIGIEMAGKASQTKEQWADAFSKGELEMTATLCADICKRRNIPVRFLSDRELREGKSGFASHDAVSRVFGDDIRDDPGANFPWNKFLADVEAILKGEEMVRFVLEDAESGDAVVQSSAVEETFDEEKAKLAEFLGATAARDDKVGELVRKLRDGNVRLQRVNAD